MPTDRYLRAQLEDLEDGNYVASYVAVTTNNLGTVVSREPTRRQCPSENAARQWLDTEAAARGIERVELVWATISGPV